MIDKTEVIIPNKSGRFTAYYRRFPEIIVEVNRREDAKEELKKVAALFTSRFSEEIPQIKKLQKEFVDIKKEIKDKIDLIDVVLDSIKDVVLKEHNILESIFVPTEDLSIRISPSVQGGSLTDNWNPVYYLFRIYYKKKEYCYDGSGSWLNKSRDLTEKERDSELIYNIITNGEMLESSISVRVESFVKDLAHRFSIPVELCKENFIFE